MSEPYIEDGWLCEPCEPDYAPGISQAIPGSWSKPLVNLTDLHGYDEMIAAAEQRGAIKALREARQAWHDHADQMTDMPSKYYPAVWLRNRADQEADDEKH